MCVWRAQETNNRTFCQSSKCFSIAVSQESGVPSAIFNDFSELLGEGWKVRSVASVQLCRRMQLPPAAPFCIAQHTTFHFASFCINWKKKRPSHRKLRITASCIEFFLFLEQQQRQIPPGDPPFPLFWHSEKMSAYYLFTRRTRRRARATVPRLKMERTS